MDTNAISNAITQFGFPIVACVALGWFIYTIWTKSQAQNEQREEKLYAVIAQAQEQNEKLSETNANFVEVLKNYKTDLETIKTDVCEIKAKVNN